MTKKRAITEQLTHDQHWGSAMWKQALYSKPRRLKPGTVRSNTFFSPEHQFWMTYTFFLNFSTYSFVVFPIKTCFPFFCKTPSNFAFSWQVDIPLPIMFIIIQEPDNYSVIKSPNYEVVWIIKEQFKRIIFFHLK